MVRHNDFLSQFVKSAIVEDETMLGAREIAEDLNVPAIPPETGAILGALSRISGGKHIIEVGTGAGISSLWLLSGMVSQGILTTIDKDHDVHFAARDNFAKAGINANRVRFIKGWAEEVLPRFSDHSYDIVFIDAVVSNAPALIEEAFRVLRPGGSIIINGIGAGAEKATGFNSEEKHFAREIFTIIGDNESLMPALIPTGTGLLVAVKDPVSTGK